MNAHALLKVNPLLSDRVRLAIMAALVAAKEPLDFNTLLQSLEVTKGNLSTHLRKLEEGGLITATKTFIGRKPNSSYQETETGRQAVQEYLRALETALAETKNEK